MNKLHFLVLLFLIPHMVISQHMCNEDSWLDKLIEGYGKPLINYQSGNFKDLDFSKILASPNYFLGYIGQGKKRLRIIYTSIKKASDNELKYVVSGKTLVGNNERMFKGFIEIQEACSFDGFLYGVDDWMKGKIKDQGVAYGIFNFSENSVQTSTGFFNGRVALRWYINQKNILRYDDIQNDSDSYCNNQYLGSWTSYRTNKSSLCAWGQYRIPCSGNLDIGAAEFSPNPKYNWSKNEDYKWENQQKVSRYWRGTFTFEYGGTHMGESFEGSVRFEIKNDNIKIFYDGSIENVEIFSVNADTLKLKNENDEIYSLYQSETGDIRVKGHPIYMLSPPNESYVLRKTE